MKQYVGEKRGRLEGLDKATGRALYAGDYRMENMLELVLVRSTISHGSVRSIDVSALPEDVMVFTGKDCAENIVADIFCDTPVFAGERILYLGEPIAVVAADTREKAEAAAKLVKVEYDLLPVVRDVEDAKNPAMPVLHGESNLLTDFFNEKGNVEKGFAESYLIVEDDFETPPQDHGYMEPDACFAYVEDDRLMAYTSSQNVFADRVMICRALGLTPEQVRVRAAFVGGGFGGKDGHTCQIYPCLVSWLTKRPAKIVLDRREVLACTYKRHGIKMHVKMGFSKEGKMLAFDGSAVLDTGAYAGYGASVHGLFTEHFTGPYDIPNVRLKTETYYTNKATAHAMRGFGAPQGAFATESIISRAIARLGLDPIQMRLDNALEKGSTGSLGQPMDHCVGLKDALKLVQESDLWKERAANTDPYVGYGVAGGFLSCGLGQKITDNAKVSVQEREDGGFDIGVGLVDIGQGSGTALAAMAADLLETDIENIHMVMADTDKTEDCGPTAASRSVFIAGNALMAAVKQYKKAKEAAECGIVPAKGEAAFPESTMDMGRIGFPHAMYTFVAQAVKLRVDPVTGSVSLLDIAAATECGKVINPLGLSGQIQGGIGMSIGFCLGEDCSFKDGVLVHKDFSTYLMPTAMDVPNIASYHVDAYEVSGPMGVKGAAEVSTVSIAAAINEAVRQASGAELNKLPLSPEEILKALESREE
ncbi:MAG: xanthine dehydrogenase family protein molybdopterin-binding subunit [Oscillospiraceae bacterium]|nr:xanthine dehydrogenase family protein molybdopterin-binding subunit [Oscillospiraceae bacterium]